MVIVSKVGLAEEALDRVLQEDFDTVLDVGCGNGQHYRRFTAVGKKCTPTDLKRQFDEVIGGDYNELPFERHDLVWVSHVLEHQLDVQRFLTKIVRETKDGGLIAVTVPPLKHKIVSGHVSLWNCGLLMYRMVLAGLDCRDIRLKTYGYNCSAIVRKKTFNVPWHDLTMNEGDLETLSPWLPEFAHTPFDGAIKEFNW